MDKPVVQTRSTPRVGSPPGKRPVAAAARKVRATRGDGAGTRSLILESARRRLVDQGYANLSVRDIAADAGLNHALIGYHFQGKQQLVLAVLDEANTRLLERQTRMYAAAAPASQKWRQACEFYDEDLASGYVKLLLELMGASFHDLELRREFTPRLLSWQALIEEAVDGFIAGHRLDLPVSGRAIAAWVTWFWMGMESSMALGIGEEQGHQREALAAMATLLERVEAGAVPRKTRRTR